MHTRHTLFLAHTHIYIRVYIYIHDKRCTYTHTTHTKRDTCTYNTNNDANSTIQVPLKKITRAKARRGCKEGSGYEPLSPAG